MYRRKPQGWKKHIDFILLDVLSLLVSFALACFVRHGRETVYLFHHYVGVFSFYLLTVIFLHTFNNTFSGVLKRGFYKEFSNTVKHVALAEMFAIAFLFAMQDSGEFSRMVIFSIAVFYAIVSYIARIIWKRIVRNRGFVFKRAALYIITTKAMAQATVEELQTYTKGEYCVQGMCILDENCVGDRIGDVPVTSCENSLLDFLCTQWIDEVYMSLPEKDGIPHHLIDKLTEMGIVVHFVLDQVGTEHWQIRQVQYIGSRVVQTISLTDVSIRHALAKRVMDIAGGIVGCLITVVLTIVLGPVIYVQSPGPIFFAQTRVGKNGRRFKLYKFRSMYPDAEVRKAELMDKNIVSDGMMFKMEADPRIIGCKVLPDGTVKKGIGNFIRDYSLDEFPQFWNVLKGELSLVGTRPPTLDEWEKYNYHHRARMSIKPGITGLWQVSGRSKITDFEKVVELDTKYIREWNLGLDMKILLKTILVLFRKDGAM